MRVLRTIASVVLLSFVVSANARAQAVAGSQLSGVVRDGTGGAIPGAEVTVTWDCYLKTFDRRVLGGPLRKL